jgi:hypothetical protein
MPFRLIADTYPKPREMTPTEPMIELWSAMISSPAQAM